MATTVRSGAANLLTLLRDRRWIVDAVLVVVFLTLFSRHLSPSTLFWDEWIYVREIQATGSAWRWIFAPTTSHVFIPAKALFAALYEVFGYDGMPFKVMSLALHATTALVLRRLVSRFAGLLLAYLIMAVFLFSTAYEEVVAWTAHFREQFFVLFLLCWLWCSHIVFNAEQTATRRNLVAAAGATSFALMTVSFANASFGLAFLALFSLVFHRALWRERTYATFLIAAAAGVLALHFGLFAEPQKAQIADQYTKAFALSPSSLMEFAAVAGHFTYAGVLAPLVRIGPWPILAMMAVGALLATTAAGAIRRARAGATSLELSYVVFFGAAFMAMILAQVWFRRDIAFLLNWSKYSFFPIAMLLPVLAWSAQGLGARTGAAFLAVLAGTALLGDFSKDRRDYLGLSRDARVLELARNLDETFADGPAGISALPDLRFPWNIFIPDAAPTLSTLWRASPATRDTPMAFFDSQTSEGAARLGALLASLPSDSKVRHFIIAYLPRNERPAAGDGGISKPLVAGAAFVQELVVDTDSSFLTNLVLVAGTGGETSKARIEVALMDARFNILLSQRVDARTLNNNVATLIPTPHLLLTAGRYFLVVRAAAASGGPPIVLYQTREPYPHLGASYECQLDVGQAPGPSDCIAPRHRRDLSFGVAFTTSAAPSAK